MTSEITGNPDIPLQPNGRRGIFYNVPASGHINPTLSVVKELVRRGHEIIYFATESARAKVEATGATFRPYPSLITDHFFEIHNLDGSNPPGSAELLAETSEALLPELIAEAQALKPDYILYDSMTPWGWMIAQALGLPSVCSTALLVLTPSLIFRPKTLPSLLRVMLKGLPHIRKVMTVMQRLGKQYGFKPLSFTEIFNAPGDLNLNYTSQVFQPGAEKLAASIKFVGPSIGVRTPQPFPFEKLSEDKPLIYISLGTVINTNRDFFRACIDAFRDAPYQVVMSIGERLRLADFGSIPANFIVMQSVPQLQILERSALFITHGGMNSVQEGLYYNVPLLVVPQQEEQGYVARRVQELGAGLMLANRQVTAQRLQALTERILHDDSVKEKAEILGASLRQAGGYRRAADEIEQFLMSRTVVS
jgi:MGT family glycosyltransferase